MSQHDKTYNKTCATSEDSAKSDQSHTFYSLQIIQKQVTEKSPGNATITSRSPS